VFSSFVNVELVSNFHYSHLNFKASIFNDSMTIGIVLLKFLLFDHVEILKANVTKGRKWFK